MKLSINKLLISLPVFFFSAGLFAEVSFSGFAGAKAELSSSDTEKFEPALCMQSFFSGQFNLSENIISHAEFSLQTEDLIDNSLFKNTPATFRIDELSIIFRRQLLDATNYLSAFLGTYEPIGSDIFLRRQFGIQPIASRLTESWLGLQGSVIYPTFGVGGADVIHFNRQPLAVGLYLYVNHELDDCYSLNTDLRFAGVYRFFAFDFAGGLGMPLKENENQDAFIVIDTLYGRAGINLLLGNSYTTSLFLQAGITEVPFTKTDDISIDIKNTYLLFEPRFRTKKCQINITVFSLPQETVDGFKFVNDTEVRTITEADSHGVLYTENRFINIHDTLGLNIDIFTDNLYISNKAFEFGINSAWTFTDKTIKNLYEKPEELLDDYNILVAPYVGTKFYNGEIHAMLQARVTDFIEDDVGSALSFNIGYKTQF